jgi:phosphate transport system permease protein
MTTLDTTRVGLPPAGGVPDDLRHTSLPLRRRITDVVMKSLMWVAVALAVIPLAAVIYYTVAKGASVINWHFLTADRMSNAPDTALSSPRSTMGPAVVGTVVMTGVAALIAIPLGVLGAIYLNEYGKTSWLARTIRTLADIMTGVPSIVMGLFIYLIVVVPHLVNGDLGRASLAGSFALACLMLPVVVRSSEEMLRLVPDELRQASLALGARKWRTTLTVVLPAAISGITSGALLAIARAAGETAPVYIVAGFSSRSQWDPTSESTSLPAQIFQNANQTIEAAQTRGWGAALTLIVIVLATTLIARFISARFAIKER